MNPVASTVANYSGRASSFASWAFGSEAAGGAAARDIFLRALRRTFPSEQLKIMDAGCGPGRDLLAFKKLGLYAVPGPFFTGQCHRSE
eukprot:NODE_1113_length_997_cov_111.457806_g923_i0.p3 GENE.NODE_1113_length_997_cov_111.457806_g923_i0~~NODE_1113_length_997_cov_111.457806_g923_i0.p3  ORF type:complete len:88 (-),score=4.97 NODE_1113_length_997_cov_111.457806_g923_i0:645-908(-)